MSDAKLRASGSLAARHRAGEVVPGYTTARNRLCAGCPGCGFPKDDACPAHHGFQELGLIRLMAFLGDEEALGIVADLEECVFCGDVDPPDEEDEEEYTGNGGCCTGCANMDHGSPRRRLEDWTKRLQDLAAKLPPKRVEVGCGCHLGLVFVDDGDIVGHRQHAACHGTGKVTHDTPAEQWLLVLAAWAVARGVHAATCGCEIGSTRKHPPSSPEHHPACDEILKALAACEAWLKEPASERRECWDLLQFLELPGWVVVAGGQELDGSTPTEALLAAAKVLGEPRVREIVSAALLEVVRPPV